MLRSCRSDGVDKLLIGNQVVQNMEQLVRP
jgi:hypothetical protein